MAQSLILEGNIMDKEQMIKAIENMTVLELSELIKAIEEKFGVSAAAPAAVAGDSIAPVAEKTEFSVILKSSGASKINVIKLVREITGLGLKEAKDLVDNVPKPVKEKINKIDADTIAAKLKEVGAEIEIK